MLPDCPPGARRTWLSGIRAMGARVRWRILSRDDRAATVAEYAVVLGVVTVALLLVLSRFSDALGGATQRATVAMSSVVDGATSSAPATPPEGEASGGSGPGNGNGAGNGNNGNNGNGNNGNNGNGNNGNGNGNNGNGNGNNGNGNNGNGNSGNGNSGNGNNGNNGNGNGNRP